MRSPTFTESPPNHIIATIARFSIMALTGLNSAEILPALTAAFSISSALSLKRSCSYFCFEKALTALAPTRFSRVISEVLSSFFCIDLKKGIVLVVTSHITIATSGITRTKISANFASIIKAMIVEPITRKGALTTSLISIATATCS